MEKTVTHKKEEVKKQTLLSMVSDEVRAMLEKLREDNAKAERLSRMETQKQGASHL